MILTAVYISLILPCDALLFDLFKQYGFDGSTTVYGMTCLNSDYSPTCGWKLILYSTLPVQNITGGSEFFTYTPVDNKTILLNAVSKYNDLTFMGLVCPNIEIKGSFL
ncbi:hypothetical protein BgiMline_025267 [Biomphalaria glabrata]